MFNRPEVVREEVRARVHEAARSLGYCGPSPQGRLLRTGKVNAIGFAADQPLHYLFSDPWACRLLTEVADVCDARGAGLALVSVTEEQPTGWNIESALVDGFLLSGTGRQLLVETTQKRGLPFVSLSLDAHDPDVPAVCIDDFGGAQAAARHLLDLGHRRFAVLGFALGDSPGRVMPDELDRATRSMNVLERARGYWAALGEAGILEVEVPLHAVSWDGSTIGEALALLFADGETAPTALLAMSDRVALAALADVAARGLRVPQDVSVIGFDGVLEAARSPLPLTTMEQPFREIAERSVAAILDDALPHGREVLPLRLVVRGEHGAGACATPQGLGRAPWTGLAGPCPPCRGRGATLRPALRGRRSLMPSAQGGCLCGRIRHEVHAEPTNVTMCRFCQTTTGTADMVEPVVEKADFVLLSREPQIDEHVSEASSERLFIHFCPECGTHTHLLLERWPDEVGVSAGTFDDPNWFQIDPENSKHIVLGVAIHGTMIPPHTTAFEEHGRTFENVPIAPRIFDQAMAIGSPEHRPPLSQGDWQEAVRCFEERSSSSIQPFWA